MSIRYGEITLEEGQTSANANITNMISFQAYKELTGEAVSISAEQGTDFVTFSIFDDYSDDLIIKYVYDV